MDGPANEMNFWNKHASISVLRIVKQVMEFMIMASRNEMNGVLGHNSALKGYTEPGIWAKEMNCYESCPRCRINHFTC